MSVPMHEDFAGLAVDPGVVQIADGDDRFGMVNVIAFGGAADRHPHVPTELGRLGGVAIWESTGANDALPFWNTNLIDDVYLYLVYGEVRIDFKEFVGEKMLGSYVGRTGDLMRLPKDVAHRTFSTNGRRRISIELAPYDPHWASLDWVADVAAFDDLELAGLTIDPGQDTSVISLGESRVETSSSFLLRGARALVAFGIHLGHNEFEGGFIVSDGDDGAVLKVAGSEVRCPHDEAVGLLKGVIGRLEALGV
jgi:hypothetical protein